MSDLSKIYDALIAGRNNGEALMVWITSANARDLVQIRQRSIEEGIVACQRLQSDLRDGRKYIEPPDDWKPTECYCGAPTCSPPCGFCTNSANNKQD